MNSINVLWYMLLIWFYAVRIDGDMISVPHVLFIFPRSYDLRYLMRVEAGNPHETRLYFEQAGERVGTAYVLPMLRGYRDLREELGRHVARNTAASCQNSLRSKQSGAGLNPL